VHPEVFRRVVNFFFDAESEIHREIFPEEQNVNAEFYVGGSATEENWTS
jgi:hypothetical protein